MRISRHLIMRASHVSVYHSYLYLIHYSLRLYLIFLTSARVGYMRAPHYPLMGDSRLAHTGGSEPLLPLLHVHVFVKKNDLFLAIATPLAALLPLTASFFRPEPPSWLRPRCGRPTRRQHFNTRTTMLAVRCPDREQGCGDVPTACDSTAIQQFALPNVVERILEWQ